MASTMAMPFLPSKQQAQALLLKRELELKQAEENQRRFAAFREDFISYLREYSSPLLNELQESRVSSPILPVTPHVSSIQLRPPDPPYLNPSEPYGPPSSSYKPMAKKSKNLLKYSCEEIEERMANGLCIFCGEQDTPGHQDLKHKGAMILVTERDELAMDETLVESDTSLIEAATVPNPDPFVKPLEHVASALLVSIVLRQEDDVGKTVAEEEKLNVSLKQNVEHKEGSQSLEATLVWEPGGFITKSATQSQGIGSNDAQPLDTTGQLNLNGEMTTLRPVDSGVMIVKVAGGVMDDKLSFTDHKSSELIDTQFSRQRSGQVTEPSSLKSKNHVINVNDSGPRVWEPGGLSVIAVQWYWPEKYFQDVPRLLVSASEFGAEFHKAPLPNEKLLCDETLGRFIRVKKLTAASCHSGVMLGWFSSGCVKSVTDENILVNKLKVAETMKLVAGLRQSIFAGIKFYLKHKWRSRIFSSKKVEMSTEELPRTSQSQNCLLSASVWNLLIKQSRNCCFLEFLLQWKWYPPEQSCQACSSWFLRLWTWQKRVRFLSSRWLIFGEMVASPSYITGQRCIKLTQTHVDVVICISTEMTSVTNTSVTNTLSVVCVVCLCGMHIWLAGSWNKEMCKNWWYKFKESSESCRIQKSWKSVERETPQTVSHMCHRWKNKSELDAKKKKFTEDAIHFKMDVYTDVYGLDADNKDDNTVLGLLGELRLARRMITEVEKIQDKTTGLTSISYYLVLHMWKEHPPDQATSELFYPHFNNIERVERKRTNLLMFSSLGTKMI